MLAKHLREGYQLLNPDGSVFGVITQLWADRHSGPGGPIVGASVRYNDGGTADRVFRLDAHVQYVAPEVAAWA